MAVVALVLGACGSESQWADPEGHERTVQLQETYGPLMVGTWHYEHVGDRHRFSEELTFAADGTFTGSRTWQTRSLVTVDGEEVYTDWADVEGMVGNGPPPQPTPTTCFSAMPTTLRSSSPGSIITTRTDGQPTLGIPDSSWINQAAKPSGGFQIRTTCTGIIISNYDFYELNESLLT